MQQACMLQLMGIKGRADAGAIDALMLLDKHIAPGCILLFDDLVNYPGYQDHEILALWEWLEATGRKLEVTHHCQSIYVAFKTLHSS